MNFACFRHKTVWPAAGSPPWADMVERWYQLDGPALAIAETYWKYRPELGKPPAWILLASPGGSNVTDHQFASTYFPRPAKFVHTLPNMRGVALLQLMKWSGQVLCLQKDPGTVLFAVTESLRLAAQEKAPVWLASSRPLDTDTWLAELYIFGGEGAFEAAPSTEPAQSTQDAEWWAWLAGGERKFLADGFEIIKK